jgi:putative transcriptional regulator
MAPHTHPLDDEPDFLAGRLLVAMPGIGDPRFERAVIYMCAHDDEHAMGLTLNRPVDGLTVPDLLARLEIEPAIDVAPDLVLMGGPVEKGRGFVLHTDDYEAPGGTLVVTDHVSLTPTREVLEAMASGDHRPRRALLALGYAGWGPGQLEREVRENVWLVCDPDEALIFDSDFEHKWSRALFTLGVDAGSLSAQAGRA